MPVDSCAAHVLELQQAVLTSSNLASSQVLQQQHPLAVTAGQLLQA
jgi:hypothetical protein